MEVRPQRPQRAIRLDYAELNDTGRKIPLNPPPIPQEAAPIPQVQELQPQPQQFKKVNLSPFKELKEDLVLIMHNYIELVESS
jgi:hypothetical protein